MHTEQTDENLNQFRSRFPRHLELDRAVYEYVFDMTNKRQCISGDVIRQKVQQLLTKTNEKLHADNKITLTFSEGWLHSFKKRWHLRYYKLHGESGYVNEDVVTKELAKLAEKSGCTSRSMFTIVTSLACFIR